MCYHTQGQHTVESKTVRAPLQSKTGMSKGQKGLVPTEHVLVRTTTGPPLWGDPVVVETRGRKAFSEGTFALLCAGWFRRLKGC